MRHHYWVNETAGKQFVTLLGFWKFESIKERLRHFVLTVLERTMFLFWHQNFLISYTLMA